MSLDPSPLHGRVTWLAEQNRWYTSILRGHYGYHGLPHNFPALNAFHQEIRRIWFRSLRRRSQRARTLTWDKFTALLSRFPLPPPRITRPWAARTA
jgi:RNA-directed DNA polymerase